MDCSNLIFFRIFFFNYYYYFCTSLWCGLGFLEHRQTQENCQKVENTHTLVLIRRDGQRFSAGPIGSGWEAMTTPCFIRISLKMKGKGHKGSELEVVYLLKHEAKCYPLLRQLCYSLDQCPAARRVGRDFQSRDATHAVQI